MKVSDVIFILDLAMSIGIPAVRKIVEAWDKETVTREDIEQLRDIKTYDQF